MKENKYLPTPVAYGQSCINMNTDFSCRNGCIYCFGKNWKDRNKKFEPKEMVKMLPDGIIETPIGINNSASDPFQPGTKERTFELLDLLNGKAKIIMLITKEAISEYEIKRLEKYNMKIFIFMSYAGLPKEYENLKDDRRIETLKLLKQSKILTTVLYARPLINRVNDFDKIREASKYVDYLVWSSIRVDENNKHKLLPEPTGENLHKSHKRISNSDLEYIENNLKGIGIRFFRKTSCVISFEMKIADYNCHWIAPELYGCNFCDSFQKKLCFSKKEDTPIFTSEIDNVIKKYKLPNYKRSIPGAFILENNMKQFSCLRVGILRKITGFQVLFENPYSQEKELITAENLAYKHYELRGEEEGNIQIK